MTNNKPVYVNNTTDFKFLALGYEMPFLFEGREYKTLWHVVESNKYAHSDTIEIEGKKMMLAWYLLDLPIKEAVKITKERHATKEGYHQNISTILFNAVMARINTNEEFSRKLLETDSRRIVYASPLDTVWGGRNNRLGFLLEKVRESLLHNSIEA